MNPSEPASLAGTVNVLQAQLAQAQQNMANLQNELQQVNSAYDHAQGEINQLKSQRGIPEPVKFKSSKPISFTGEDLEPVLSWVTHMDSFLGDAPGSNSLNVACSYLDGHAHEWCIIYRQNEEGSVIATWLQLKDALTQRFQALNKEKIARDKLAKW